MKPTVALDVQLGPVRLRTPLIAASGTVGSVAAWAGVAPVSAYGAAVAKSVSGEPWEGNPVPRMAPAGAGMLNAIGIQNPGVEAWAEQVGPLVAGLGVPVWGSAVGESVDEYARVAKTLEKAGVAAVEINLSCPNLGGSLFALDPAASAEVVAAVRGATSVPIGAKLSPNATDVVAVARAAAEAGADWVVLTNTAWGAAIDPATRRPALARVVGGLSGAPLKPLAMRCVWQVHQALPDLPIVGSGGIFSGDDAAEYMLAGASAVSLGSVHFAEPKAGKRILRELSEYCRHQGVDRVADLTGGAVPW